MNSYILDMVCGNCNRDDPAACQQCYRAMKNRESRMRLSKRDSAVLENIGNISASQDFKEVVVA